MIQNNEPIAHLSIFERDQFLRGILLIALIILFPIPILSLNSTEPNIVKSYLDELGLHTGTWKKDGDKYFCCSPYKMIGGLQLNSIAYYVDGTENNADQLQLVLNVNDMRESILALEELINASKLLVKKSAGITLPDSFINALYTGTSISLNSNDYSITDYLITLKKETWPTKKYSLTVTVQRQTNSKSIEHNKQTKVTFTDTMATIKTIKRLTLDDIELKIDTTNSIVNHKYFFKNNLIASKMFNLSDSLLSTTGIIPDGTVKKFDNNNNIIFECIYKNGKKNGESKTYFDNGNVENTSFYVNDTINGEVKQYYINGTLKVSAFGKNNKRNGEFKTYFNDGNIENVFSYVNDILNGEFKQYYHNGNLKVNGTKKNGFYHGKIEVFDSLGKIIERGNFINGNGEIYGQENGKLKYTELHKNGIRIKYTSFSENEKPEEINFYNTITGIIDSSYEYNENNQLYRILHYFNDNHVKTILFLPSGDTSQIYTKNQENEWVCIRKYGVKGIGGFNWQTKSSVLKPKFNTWVNQEKYVEYFGSTSSKFHRSFKEESLTGTEMFITDNYYIGKLKTFAGFIFMNNKLIKAIVQIPSNTDNTIIEELIKKYGEPKNIENSKGEFSDFKTLAIELFKNGQELSFFNNTIRYRINVNALMGNNGYLVYEIFNLKEIYEKAIREKVAGGL